MTRTRAAARAGAAGDRGGEEVGGGAWRRPRGPSPRWSAAGGRRARSGDRRSRPRRGRAGSRARARRPRRRRRRRSSPTGRTPRSAAGGRRAATRRPPSAPSTECGELTIVASSPSAAQTSATTISAGRSGVVGRLGVSTASRRWPSAWKCSSIMVTPRAVVEQHLADRAAGQRVADRDDGQRLAELLPQRRRGIERRHDEPVDPLVAEPVGERPLALGLAARVGHEHVQVVAAEPAAERLDEALLAQVLERAGEHADEPGPAAGERARDRVAGVAELLGGLPHALLRLGGRLHARAARRRPPPGRARSRLRRRGSWLVSAGAPLQPYRPGTAGTRRARPRQPALRRRLIGEPRQ